MTGLCPTASRHDYRSSYALALRLLRAKSEGTALPLNVPNGGKAGVPISEDLPQSAERSLVSVDTASLPPGSQAVTLMAGASLLPAVLFTPRQEDMGASLTSFGSGCRPSDRAA